MLPGQYAVHQGRPAQVLAIQDTQLSGHGGLPVPATLYTLKDPLEVWSVVVPHQSAHGIRVEDYPSPRLLPACQACEAKAGEGCLHVTQRAGLDA